MSKRYYFAAIALAALSLPALCLAQQTGPKLYRWVDENGKVYYSDKVPPQQATRDRSILNNQGVAVGFEEGEVTPEERAEKNRIAAAVEAERVARADVARRDRMLLETYLSVDDIEGLRDRRLELLESQIKVTELYLANLRKRLVSLQKEASNFKPYAAREDAPQIPANLALDVSRTTSSIELYEKTLTRTRVDQEALRLSFNRDIERFRELKSQGG
jgi:Domain of unknown function (DUF4124)